MTPTSSFNRKNDYFSPSQLGQIKYSKDDRPLFPELNKASKLTIKIIQEPKKILPKEAAPTAIKLKKGPILSSTPYPNKAVAMQKTTVKKGRFSKALFLFFLIIFFFTAGYLLSTIL